MKIERSIRDTRKTRTQIEPRTFTAPAGAMNFHATGIIVTQIIDSDRADGEWGKRMNSRRHVKLEGYSVKRDGTRGRGTKATTELPLDLDSAHAADHMGLRWYVTPEHYPEIRELAEQARAEFDAVDWDAAASEWGK